MSDEVRPVIVVGVDGSELSIGALRWGAQQARLIGADVVAVTGYDIPWTIFFAPTATEADYAMNAQKALDESVATALGPEPDVRVEKRLIGQRPAFALTHTAEAEGAQLLIVGSHGRGELPGMHLGSVATFCVHHAPCPVLVFRGPHTGR